MKRAYKYKYPCLLTYLHPLPQFERIDYIAHLFIYYGNKPYEIFNEESYPLLDRVNSSVQFYLEKNYDKFPNEYEKSDKDKMSPKLEQAIMNNPRIEKLINEQNNLISKYSPTETQEQELQMIYRDPGYELDEKIKALRDSIEMSKLQKFGRFEI